MKNPLGAYQKGTRFFDWYYIVVILGYIATLFSGLVRPGVFAAVMMVGVIAELILRKYLNIHSVMDVLIVAYFTYKALSVIWIIMSGMPVSIYLGEFAVSLLPMVFYFAGKAGGPSEERNKPCGFYEKFLWAIVVLDAVSLIMYITAPQFYCDYLYNWSYISKADADTMRVRMQSVVGSTVFGAINILGMATSLHFMLDEFTNGVSNTKQRLLGVFFAVTTFVFAILSNQRACMVAGIVLLIYVNCLIFAKLGKSAGKYIYIEIGVFALAIVLLLVVRPDFVIKVFRRIVSLPGAISQRSEQWVAAVNNMYSSWFGNGLGMNGHKAIGTPGTHVIADGGLIKMYCEEGVLGFSVFVYMIFLTFKKGVSDIKKHFAEIGIVFMALLLSIGSNVLAFQLATPIFWFAIGRMNAEREEKS